MTTEILFTELAGTTIPSGTEIIHTSGYSAKGVGKAGYVSDATVNSAFVTANPRWAVRDMAGRGFRLNEERPNPTMTGMLPDNATDSLPAILACLKYMETYFITNIDWPEGEYYCSDTIQFKQQVIINGPAGGQEPGVTGQEHNYLRVPANKAGFVFNRYNMLDDAVVAGGGRADASIIRGMHLEGGGGTANATGRASKRIAGSSSRTFISAASQDTAFI